ncbi:MAG: metallophosphoesterase [Thermacetogeniaceae bacterium]
MWVGVLSDSHGDVGQAERAVKAMGAVDLVIHAGDFYSDALYLADQFGIEVKAVTGNCDRCVPGPHEELLELEGHRIYLTHGHFYGVKLGLMRLADRVREVGAEMAIFGHTHMFRYEEVDGIRYLNPGSVAWPRIPGQFTYAIMKLEPGIPITVEQFTLT